MQATIMKSSTLNIAFRDVVGDDVPKENIINALKEEILKCEDRFVGHYVVSVGKHAEVPVEPGITWLRHDPCQRGIGFFFRSVEEGKKTFCVRKYSILPPPGVNASELHLALTGMAPVVLSVEAKVEKPVEPVPSALDATVQLAQALKKVRDMKAELAVLLVEEEALLPEVLALEAQAAAVQDVDALVEARLNELMGL